MRAEGAAEQGQRSVTSSATMVKGIDERSIQERGLDEAIQDPVLG